MAAHPLSVALTLDRLQAAGLIRALIASPVVVLGGGFVGVMVVVRLAALAQGLSLGASEAGLAGGTVAAVVFLALTLSIAPRERAREGPLGFAFIAPRFTGRVAAVRAGLLSAPLLILALTLIVLKRPDLAVAGGVGLISGSVSGLALGVLVIRLTALGTASTSLRRLERPFLRMAPAVSSGVAALALALVAARLQAQGADQAAQAAAVAGLGLAALGALRVDTVRFALIASLPTSLWRSLLPLLLLPLLICGAVATAMLLLLGTAPAPALGLGGLAGLAGATLRVLMALSSLGRSQVGAQQAAAVELLILTLLGLSGLFLLAPLWIAFRTIWLWRRAERVRWREATT